MGTYSVKVNHPEPKGRYFTCVIKDGTIEGPNDILDSLRGIHFCYTFTFSDLVTFYT